MQKIRIDFNNPGLPQHISAVENDSQSRFFEATLYENGKAYTAPTGAAYSIMYRGFGPQNQGWYDTINDGAGKRSACKVSGNVVTCEIARQALQVPGHVSIVLCVTTGKGYMLKSWPIECDCKNDRYDSTAEIQSLFYITQVSNADWNQAIQAWENLKDAIDPTLSLSGKAADAAKTREMVNAEATRAKAAEEKNAQGIGQLKEDLGDLATVGKNLFNQNGTRHLNSDIDFAGDIVSGEYIVYELPIDGGTYVSNMPTAGVHKIACISKDGVATIVTPSTTSDFEEHFTLPDRTVKVYMSFWSGRDSDVESNYYIIFKKGMIVSGNTLPSEYIPYYKNLNDTIKVNESNIEDGTELNKYIDVEKIGGEVSNNLFNETLNLIDSSSYVRGTLSTSGVVVESSDTTSNYIYTIKIPDATFIGMNAVPQIICFYDKNMGLLDGETFESTSDDTLSVSVPAKSKYAKLSYWYGRGVDGSFERVTHLKDISVTVDSVPFSAIKREPVLDSSHKISSDNLCDGFELNSKLAKGIKWYILGDSRSVDTAYTAKFYHDYLCEKHKFIRKKNLAVSGARIRSADTAYHSLLEQYPSVGDDADLITVYAGINDYGQDNPTEIGTEGSTDLTTLYGAFESLITNLITSHPTAKIVVITPIPQFNFEINNTIIWGDRNDTNSLGKSLDDYCNVIKKICRKYGVFVKDACYESGITPRIASQRTEYFKDGLHHNEKGQLVLANYLSDIFDLLDC